MRIFDCKHTQLRMMRSHPDSERGKQTRLACIAIDKYGCQLTIQCKKCGNYLTINSTLEMSLSDGDLKAVNL